MNWRELALADIKSDEALRLESYLDSEGIWTLGYGHTKNVGPSQSCTEPQADIWLIQDTGAAERDLNLNASWWIVAPESVRRGLLNMCFNLGWPRLSQFSQMLACGEAQNYTGMAEQALKSKWATQVGPRAVRIANLFESAAQLELAV